MSPRPETRTARCKRPVPPALAAIAAACLAAFSQPALAADPPEPAGPLAPQLEAGRQGAWTVGRDGGWLVFENTDDPDAVRHLALDVPYGEGGLKVTRARVEAETVNGSGNGPSFAGLLFNFARTGDGPRYLAFVATAGGEVAVFSRDDQGLSRVGTARADARGDGTDVLEILEEGGNASMRINGRQVFAIESPSGFPGATGIVVGGTGRFAFADVEIRGGAAAE